MAFARVVLPLADTAKQQRTPVITIALVAVNLAVFIWQLGLFLRGGEELAAAFVGRHGLVPQRLLARWSEGAQWQTLLTHMFLHGGVAHVLGNMWFLWIFGGNIEDRLGPWRFLLFYLSAGTIAAAAQFAVDPRAAIPMVGASGAISGVLGAYLVLFPGAWIWTLVPWVVPIVPVPAMLFLAVWFAIQACNGLGAFVGPITAGAGAKVAWWAHAGGFLGGVVLIAIARPRGRSRKRRR